MHWCGDAFTAEEKARAFAYYEPLTVRDSSLSACTQAVIAAEVGHLDLAADYLAEAALMDLHDLEHNTARRPAHRVAGRRLAGARRRLRRHARPRRAAVAPPAAAAGLADPDLPLRWRGYRLLVSIRPGEVEYAVADEADGLGEGLEFLDCDTAVLLRPGESVRRPLQPVHALTPRPSQPAGRAPLNIADLES